MECQKYLITHSENEIITLVQNPGGEILADPNNYKVMTKCEALDYFEDFENYDKVLELPDDINCPC